VPGIERSLEFHPLRIAVLTVSDTRDEETDRSGALLVERLTSAGHELAGKAIVPDDVEAIRVQVRAWADDPQVDVIISTGGTGFAPRDVTPEAVKPLCRREMDSRCCFTRQVTAPWACRRFSRVPLQARSTTPSSSACRARPAPAATVGTSCCATS
jgi:molybdenum cofactor biosynthesis protein B